jgi:hypothetical protein
VSAVASTAIKRLYVIGQERRRINGILRDAGLDRDTLRDLL